MLSTRHPIFNWTEQANSATLYACCRTQGDELCHGNAVGGLNIVSSVLVTASFDTALRSNIQVSSETYITSPIR